MQTINLRNKLNLHWHKGVVLLLLTLVTTTTLAQNRPTENLINYDNEWIHYGFLIGLHSAKFRTQYSDTYTTAQLDSLHSVVPEALPGWKVGFVIDMNLLKHLSFRVLPTVGFYERNLHYRFTDERVTTVLKDATMVELPLLLKYKSSRRGNVAMYALGGFKPSWEAAGRSDELESGQTLQLRDWNYSIEAGVGFDIFFQLFKFSPEVRYSWGMRNMLTDEVNDFSTPIKKLTYHNISFYVTFEGGPSYLKNNRRR